MERLTRATLRRSAFACGAALWFVAATPIVGLAAHYYSIGVISTSGVGGGYAQATIEDMYAPDCLSGGHTNQTLWTSTDNGNGWAEIGWTRGFEGSCSLLYYWAYNNPAHGYHEFLISGAVNR